MSVREAIESLYDCTATVTVRVPYEDGAVTRFREEELFSGEPCRLSFSGASSQTLSGLEAAGEAGRWSEAEQSVKLFLAPEREIPAGSKITVEGRGMTRVYARSGQPAVYGSHQEIALALWDEIA